jgi:hypothetical protein
MKSEKHRQNILNPDYKEIGVAVKQGMINGRITTVTVQMFGARKSGTVSLIPHNVTTAPEPVKNFSAVRENSSNVNQLTYKTDSFQYGYAQNHIAGDKFQYPQNVFYPNQETASKFAWVISILVLLIVIAVNSVTLSRMIKMHGAKASAMVNTVILISVLTAILFFRF